MDPRGERPADRSVDGIDCRAHVPRTCSDNSLAMTTGESIRGGAKRSVAILLDCFGASRLARTVSGYTTV